MELEHSPNGFGLHSFCAGGATAIAQAGVPNRLFKQHGRWKLDLLKNSLAVKKGCSPV